MLNGNLDVKVGMPILWHRYCDIILTLQRSETISNQKFRFIPTLTFEYIVKSGIEIQVVAVLGGEAGAEPNLFCGRGFAKRNVEPSLSFTSRPAALKMFIGCLMQLDWTFVCIYCRSLATRRPSALLLPWQNYKDIYKIEYGIYFSGL
jgi:hypothetical protein